MLSTRHKPQNKISIRQKCTDRKIQSKQKDIKKNPGVTTLISDKIDFKSKAVTRDKENHNIILKLVVHQEDITLVNKYEPNIGAPKYIRKILEDFKKEIKSNTAIIGGFNTLCQQWVDF